MSVGVIPFYNIYHIDFEHWHLCPVSKNAIMLPHLSPLHQEAILLSFFFKRSAAFLFYLYVDFQQNVFCQGIWCCMPQLLLLTRIHKLVFLSIGSVPYFLKNIYQSRAGP